MLEFLTDSLKLECRNSANISEFSLITPEGTSVSWHVLDVSKFKISLSISSLHTSENHKGLVDLSLHSSPIVSLQYFKMILITGSVIFLELELLSLYSGILILVTILEKKSFKSLLNGFYHFLSM